MLTSVGHVIHQPIDSSVVKWAG